MRVSSVPFLIAAVALLAGCASPSCRVAVNAFAAQASSAATTYALFPSSTNVTADDLEFQEYAQYLERAMIFHGYRRVASVNEAELAVFLTYGIGDPQEHSHTHNRPVYGQIGVSSATTYGNVSANAYRLGNSAYGSGSYSETTYYTPSYGVIGHTRETVNFTLFTRHVGIYADDLRIARKEGRMASAWQTRAVSVGSTGDLRRVVPVMIAGAMQYFGTSTGQAITLTVRENDRRVLFLKGLRVDAGK